MFFINSFIICALAIIGNLISCSMAAYAFARLNFRLKWLWFSLMLGSIMLPIHAQLIPQYIFFLKIGWVNTILPLVVPKFLATDAFFVFLMVQFMRSLPPELEQAATIDGASYWQRYWRIILPLSMPALVTTAVFTFIYTYNDFFSQLIYLTDTGHDDRAGGAAAVPRPERRHLVLRRPVRHGFRVDRAGARLLPRLAAPAHAGHRHPGFK